MSRLPTDSRPIQVTPDLARQLEEALAPYEGASLKAAQAAVLRVYRSRVFTPDVIAVYRAAIAEAVADHQPAKARA